MKLDVNVESAMPAALVVLGRAIRSFNANQGMLLAGAIAYNILLSVIPLFTIMLLVLSRFVPQQELLETVRRGLELTTPGLADTLVAQVAHFLDRRQIVGWVMVLVLLFFSSMAFTMLEKAMSIIFFHRVTVARRHFLVSATLPFVFMAILSSGLLVVTLASGILQTIESEQIGILGLHIPLQGLYGTGLYLLGMLGIIIMLTSVYMVVPVGRISLRHALVGGVTAGLLWEICRHGLVWYFSNISLVNVVYGSLATAVVTLLTLEVASMILLFGAQVISEYERFVGERQNAEPPVDFRT